MKKKIIITLSVVILVITAGLGFGANYLVDYAIGRNSDAGNRQIKESAKINVSDENRAIIDANKDKANQEVAVWEATNSWNNESLVSFDGTKLNALSYMQPQPTNKWVIFVHGYRQDNSKVKDYGVKYAQNGYNVLLPNNRACGDSEGDYVGMGWLDKEDIKQWISFIATNKTNDPSIIVHGRSMGGATTMMLAGDNPEYVDLYIEECGYTSVHEIFVEELDKRFNLPPFPLLNIASFISNIKAGYSFEEASSVKQLQKATKPILFIHGTEDDFVPYYMLDQVYNATNAVKEKIVFEGADHSGSRFLDPDKYWNGVFNFINQYTIQ